MPTVTNPRAPGILVGVDSPLAGIPIERRRLLAATLGLFAVLFVAVGVVASTGTTPGVVRIFSAIALVVAMVLGAIAWGITHSVTIDLREQRLDRAIEKAMAEGASTRDRPMACTCGHDHDADELHVTDADDSRCPVSGTDCAHSCDTCVLASMRPSPVRSRAERLSQQAESHGVVQG
jgi:hypothetical protein